MMNRLLLLLSIALFATSLPAAQPLKNPLSFVSADSVVVWGEDRSDYRTTALSIAPQLAVRPVSIAKVDKKQVKKDVKEWNREILPALNLSGAMADEQGEIAIVPTANIVQKAGKLFLATAEAQYMDVVERLALNALMSVATPGELSFEKHIAAQALMNVSGMVYAVDEAGVFVNLYINSSTHVKTDQQNFVIDQLTAMPHEGRVKLRIGGLSKGLQPIKLRLRMPNWTFSQQSTVYRFGLQGTPDQLPTIYVNGREETFPLEDGYVVIDRVWNNGDEVYFDFPFNAQCLYSLNNGKINESIVAFQRGPLVYGFQHPTEHFTFDKSRKIEEENTPNTYGHTVLSVPVIKNDGLESAIKAEPLMDGARYLWMNLAKPVVR